MHHLASIKAAVEESECQARGRMVAAEARVVQGEAREASLSREVNER